LNNRFKLTAILAAVILAVGPAYSQTVSREEKREAKVRTEYVKATMDIHVPTIRADSLKARIGDTDLVLVDVRQPEEQKISMLPGALTPKEFAEKFRHGFPIGKRVVTYDVLGYRGGKYAEQLQEKGLPVQNLEGGILSWTHVQGALEARDSAGTRTPTHQVHVYARDMRNWIALDYEAVW
jgi:rhodanese-related sulfurtransferase